MSVDTTVVIFGRKNHKRGDREYTALVVQNADDLYKFNDKAIALAWLWTEKVPSQNWFGKLSLTKQFGRLLQENERMFGELEHEEMPILFMGSGKLHRCTLKGKLLERV